MSTPCWPEFRCPIHGTPLERQERQFPCPRGDRFPIRNGILRFVETSAYADAFGAQWRRYRLTQLDSHTGTPITRDRLRRCLSEDLWRNLKGKQVLECGCGAGRFTEVLLAQGAAVTSIDLSDAVEANLENFPENETHRVAQADILSLPFAPRQYDVVLCLGVIQHTPNPEETITAICSQVKPGGYLVIDHYTYSLSWYTKTAPLFRLILRRLPAEKGLVWSERLVDFFLPLHKTVRRVRLLQVIVSRLSPVLCYYSAYPQLKDDLQREWALLDTHDSLTDWFKHFRTRGQIKRTLERLGMDEIWCEYGGNGVEARARRKEPEQER